MTYVYIAVGLVLLFGGAQALVRGGVGVSQLFGFSPLVIGLIVISAGTSAPELVISLNAVLTERPDIAMGNVIGSNISNALLILGFAATIRALPTSPKVVFRDGGVMFLASAVFVALAWGGEIGIRDGLVLVAGLIGFMVLSFASEWRKPSPHSVFATRAARHTSGSVNPGGSLFLLLLGGVFLYFGAVFVISGSTLIAREFGLPEALIGLTAVAVGTSLPELLTTVVAAARGETGLAVGNIIGSSIFNILGVTGITAIVHPIKVNPMLAHEDGLIMVGATLMLVPFLVTGWKISRFEGLLLFLGYIAYLVFLAWRQGYITA
jgi:cation:H+ antiporter